MRLLYKTYQIFIVIPFVVVVSMWAGTTMAIMCPFTNWMKEKLPFSLGIMTRPDWWGSFASRWWGKLIIRVSLLPVEIKGRENIEDGKSYVFIANHQGQYDILLICGFLGKEIRWVMKRALEKVPFLGIGCKHAGYIFVDKGNAGKTRATYRKAKEALESGASIMMFPEGSRSKTGKMSSFHRGAFTLTDELQVPVVPMTINGSFEVKPRGSYLIEYHKLSLTIHKPIYPTSQGVENIERTKKESYDVILSAIASSSQK